MPSISVSEISTYRTCPQKHDYIYNQRLARQYQETGPMRLGTVYHELMAAVLKAGYYKNTPENHVPQLIDWVAKMWDKAKRPEKTIQFEGVEYPDTEFYERWEEVIATAKIMARVTVENLDIFNRFTVLDTDAFAPEYRPDGTPVPLIEYKISYPVIGTDYVFSGVIDAVVRDNNTGHIVVLDWKTKASFISVDDEIMNMQVGLYQHVLLQLGVNVTRGLIYQIKSSIGVPELNQPDKKTGIAPMSRRVIATTWELYSEALVKNGLNPDDYLDMKEKLISKPDELIQALDVYRSPTYLTNIWQQLKVHLTHISQDTGDRAMVLGFSCYSCPFKQLCRYKLEGWPIEEVINEFFIRLPEREKDVLDYSSND